MKFAREIATLPMLNEQCKLFLSHHLEVSTNPEMVLAPNPQGYIQMEERGILRWFTLRTDINHFLCHNCGRPKKHEGDSLVPNYPNFPCNGFQLGGWGGEVIGYFVFAVTPFMHHIKAIQAHQLLLFVHPHHRGAKLFDEFLHFVIGELSRNDGVQKIFFGASVKNTLHKLFERKEMTLVSRTYEYDVNRQFHPEPEEELAAPMGMTGEY